MSDVDANQNVSDAQVSDATASAQVVTTGEAAAPPGDAPAAEDGQPEGTQPGGKKPIGPRISELTAKRREAERRAEVAESLVDRLTKALAEGRVVQPSGDSRAADNQGDPQPKQADFNTYEDYLRADARWSARQEFKSLTEKTKSEVNKQSQEAEAGERWKGFTAALDEQGSGIDGFENAAGAVFGDDNFPISAAMADYLMEAADHKAGMVKWLADNRTEAARIYRLSPAAAAKELGKVDALLGSKPPPRATGATPPPPTVNGRAPAQPNLTEMGMDDYAKTRGFAKE